MVGSITAVTDRLPNIPEQDKYKLIDHTASIYDDTRNLRSQGGGMSISERLEIECDHFIGDIAHALGCDSHPQPYPQEERDPARRIKYGPSPNNESLVSLKILLHRLTILVGSKCNAVQMGTTSTRLE